MKNDQLNWKQAMEDRVVQHPPALTKQAWLAGCLMAGLLGGACQLHAAVLETSVPRAWDDAALQDLELPLATKDVARQYAPAAYYYQIPVRPIYKGYPVYHPDKEPPGYFQGLLNTEPELLWDEQETRPRLETHADWITAGEFVFNAPTVLSTSSLLGPAMGNTPFVRERAWFEQTGAPVTPQGVLPFVQYVIRERGKVELGVLSCAMCHTRVMPDGSIVRGAQGNFPFGKAFAYELRDQRVIEPAYRGMVDALYTVPWLEPDPQAELHALPLKQLAAHFDGIPPGVAARHGTGAWSPVQVPDLIGVRGRRYLDRTGLQRHRGPVDLMRYSALNQGIDMLTTYRGVLPTGQKEREDPKGFFQQRYSDEQLYALARFVYSLEPPANPNLPQTAEEKQRVERGRRLFMDAENGCATCHDPKQGYTNNKLVAAPGFEPARDHPERNWIMRQRVNTDATLTLRTRRGTGFYKVPSLLGLWYRGPLEHSGSVATLEDWFDPNRVRDDYLPTGWRGPLGTRTRAVKGHEFGLDLSLEDRKDLIAFLRTL